MVRIRNSVMSAAAAVALVLPGLLPAQAQRASLVSNVADSAALAGLRFRSIGPAVMSGRVADIAVPAAARPGERLGKTIYVATAAGGVWKTTNSSITWQPLFDAQQGDVDWRGRGCAVERERRVRGYGRGEQPAPARAGARASTSRPMRGVPGRTADCARRSTSRASSCIPPILTLST